MRTSQPTGTNNGLQGQRAGQGLSASAGQRLPVPPRERKPVLAALAVLLILGGALVSAYLVMQSGQRVSAIQIAENVPAGQKIPASALQEVEVGDTGISFINWSERLRVTQAYAAVPLVKGSLLTNGMVVSTSGGAAGRVVVGLALKPGQIPAAGLTDGQHVALYAVNGQNSGIKPGSLLAEDAIVYDARQNTGSLSDTTPVSVAVPPEQAPAVLQAASSGEIAVAVIPAGSHVTRDQGPPALPSQAPAARNTRLNTGLGSP